MTTYDDTNTLLTSKLAIPGLFVAVYSYDTRNRLAAMTDFAPDNAVISTGQRATFGYAYTLDGVGNRTKVDLTEPLIPSYNAEAINYTYYQGNILHTAAGGGSSANGATYTHDANGNRTTKSTSAGTTTYTYDSLNRVRSGT